MHTYRVTLKTSTGLQTFEVEARATKVVGPMTIFHDDDGSDVRQVRTADIATIERVGKGTPPPFVLGQLVRRDVAR